MAESYSFFDAVQTASGGYDREYSSEDLAKYFGSFVGNGVFANPANSLQVVANDSLTLSVTPGKAFINGYFYDLDETKSVAIAHGDSVNPRVDLVVLSLNLSKRLIEINVLQGAAAVSPAEPSITRSDVQHDLVLAKVSVAAGATSLSQADITDMRFDESVCGQVAGLIEQIETANLFAQYDSAFNKWFTTTKGSLSGDVAGNLSNEIAATNESVDKLTTDLAELGKRTVSIAYGGTGANTAADALNNLGITWGTAAAAKTGEPNTIYIQLLS